MKLNSELPAKHATRNRFIAWTLFYTLLISGLASLGVWANNQIGEEELPAGHIKVSVSKQHYKLGEDVHFTLTNNFPVAVRVNNFCPNEPLNVYRWDDGSWERIHDTADIESCEDQSRQVTIPANHSLTYNYGDWPQLFSKPGRYRIVAVIEHYEALPFQDFEVMAPQPKPKKPIEAKPETAPTQTAPAIDEHEDEYQVEPEHKEIESDDD